MHQELDAGIPLALVLDKTLIQALQTLGGFWREPRLGSQR
jgi:hypothetical protein